MSQHVAAHRFLGVGREHGGAVNSGDHLRKRVDNVKIHQIWRKGQQLVRSKWERQKPGSSTRRLLRTRRRVSTRAGGTERDAVGVPRVHRGQKNPSGTTRCRCPPASQGSRKHSETSRTTKAVTTLMKLQESSQSPAAML